MIDLHNHLLPRSTMARRGWRDRGIPPHAARDGVRVITATPHMAGVMNDGATRDRGGVRAAARATEAGKVELLPGRRSLHRRRGRSGPPRGADDRRRPRSLSWLEPPRPAGADEGRRDDLPAAPSVSHRSWRTPNGSPNLRISTGWRVGRLYARFQVTGASVTGKFGPGPGCPSHADKIWHVPSSDAHDVRHRLHRSPTPAHAAGQ
jgi:hypothetical protein